MPDPVTALVVGGTQLASSAVQSNAAGKAADAQGEAADKGIAEQRRQFDAMRELLSPYVDAGGKGLSGQLDLLGINGGDSQKAAVDALSSSPQFDALVKQGENGILQNASATGGLRGGNTQAALAQFRPQMLQQMIDQQYSRLGGLTALGQNSAAGVGTAGMNMGNNISNLYGQQGAAAAGQYLSEGKAISGFLNMPAQYAGAQMGAGKTPGFGF